MNVTMILSVCYGTLHLMVKELQVDFPHEIAIDQSQSHRLVSKETAQDEADRACRNVTTKPEDRNAK